MNNLQKSQNEQVYWCLENDNHQNTTLLQKEFYYQLVFFVFFLLLAKNGFDTRNVILGLFEEYH